MDRSEGLSEADREQLVSALDKIETELASITAWLPSDDMRVRRLLLDARTSVSAACWMTVRREV